MVIECASSHSELAAIRVKSSLGVSAIRPRVKLSASGLACRALSSCLPSLPLAIDCIYFEHHRKTTSSFTFNIAAAQKQNCRLSHHYSSVGVLHRQPSSHEAGILDATSFCLCLRCWCHDGLDFTIEHYMLLVPDRARSHQTYCNFSQKHHAWRC
jgi:hypothetical protein